MQSWTNLPEELLGRLIVAAPSFRRTCRLLRDLHDAHVWDVIAANTTAVFGEEEYKLYVTKDSWLPKKSALAKVTPLGVMLYQIDIFEVYKYDPVNGLVVKLKPVYSSLKETRIKFDMQTLNDVDDTVRYICNYPFVRYQFRGIELKISIMLNPKSIEIKNPTDASFDLGWHVWEKDVLDYAIDRNRFNVAEEPFGWITDQ